MLIAVFESRGMIYSHFVPHGHTINVTYHISVLKRLLHVPDYQNGHFKLHRDNTRPHVTASVLQFLN